MSSETESRVVAQTDETKPLVKEAPAHPEPANAAPCKHVPVMPPECAPPGAIPTRGQHRLLQRRQTLLVDLYQANLDLAVIGNSAISALVDKRAQIVWSCFPRFDGDPIFCSLLSRTGASNDMGVFDVLLADFKHSEQEYVKNTAVLKTRLYDGSGACLEVTDFVPCFEYLHRQFRPYEMIRKLTVLKGHPRVRIRLRPSFGYGWGMPEKTRGSNHIRYILSNTTIRLTTNAPVSYIIEETLFEIDEPVYLILMPDESLKAPIAEVAETFLAKTINEWQQRSKALSIPFEWQEDVIRAAITVQLSQFGETGAVVSSMTAGVPPWPNGRMRDGRYSWLDDAYWTISGLNVVGATHAMESYLQYIGNILASFLTSQEEEDTTENARLATEKQLQPVFGVSLETRIHERVMYRLPGYRLMGQVIVGTNDSEVVQGSVYGAVILALTQVFFDKRLQLNKCDDFMFHRLQLLGEKLCNAYKEPDMGRFGSSTEEPSVNLYTMSMSWAGADRLSKIAAHLQNNKRASYWRQMANTIRHEIDAQCFNKELGCYISRVDGTEVDASVLLLPELLFVKGQDERFLRTLELVDEQLKRGYFIAQRATDPFPSITATLWYVLALAAAGRMEQARDLYDKVRLAKNQVGLLGEFLDLNANECWGNFPSTSAQVFMLHCAHRLSKSWVQAF